MLIRQLESNASIFSQPWNNETLRLPMNAVTHKHYSGVNIFALLLASVDSGYADPRWATFKQAQKEGWKVRKGARGTQICFVQTSKESKNPKALEKTQSSETNEDTNEQQLTRPFVKRAYVFNAIHFEGIPPRALEKTHAWNPIDEAEKLIKATKVAIFHGTLNKAYYTVSRDIVYVPNREQFNSLEQYYGTVLHELAHATGHPSRLNRKIGQHQFGTEEYAREELRAEIASLILCTHTGIPYDPDRHVPYIKSWIKALSEDPKEIVVACRDADAIARYIISKGVELNVHTDIVLKPSPEPENTLPERITLHIPYAEKDTAKALAMDLGIRLLWDRTEKSWSAVGTVDISTTPLSKWLAPIRTIRQSPQEHFAEKMQRAGILVTSAILDGKWHRSPVEGGKPGSTDGGYIGYRLATPHGFYQNFKTGEKGGWSYKHDHNFSRSELEEHQRLATAARVEREHATSRSYQLAAQKASSLFAQSVAATDHPYLTNKGVAPYGTRIARDGALLIPLKTAQGEITSIQRISDAGEKRFISGGKKTGSFYELEGQAVSVRNDLFIIAEGFATAATIKESLGDTVRTVCAFDAGNLKPVGLAIRAQFPNATIVFAADSDAPQAGKEKGIGEEKALEAAKEVAGVVVTPNFGVHKEQGARVSDFNDLARLYGRDLVKTQITTSLGERLPALKESLIRITQVADQRSERHHSQNIQPHASKRSLSLGLR